MVEDRITDGKRIAQLLASELTGQSSAMLDRVSVVDATPDAEPTADGTTAYGIAIDDERIGRVTVYPETAVLSIGGEFTAETPAGLSIEGDGDEISIGIEYGAAVKRAVDVFEAVVSGR